MTEDSDPRVADTEQFLAWSADRLWPNSQPAASALASKMAGKRSR